MKNEHAMPFCSHYSLNIVLKEWMLCFFACSFKLCNKGDIKLTLLVSLLFQKMQLTSRLALHQVILGLIKMLFQWHLRLFFQTSNVGFNTSNKTQPCNEVIYSVCHLPLNILRLWFAYGELDTVNNYSYSFNTIAIL